MSDEKPMRVSPSIFILRKEMDDQPNKLAYIAAMYKPTCGLSPFPLQKPDDKQVAPPFPDAVLQIEGPVKFIEVLADEFGKKHAIPRTHIKLITRQATDSENAHDYNNSAKVNIEYYRMKKDHKIITVRLTVQDVKDSFDVQFETSPDGKEVTELSAELNRLKFLIAEKAAREKLQNVKVATKPIGIVSWETEVPGVIKTEITAKIKVGLSAEIHTTVAGGTSFTIELFGSIFVKGQEDGVVKLGGAGGFLITIPVPFLEHWRQPPSFRAGPQRDVISPSRTGPARPK